MKKWRKDVPGASRRASDLVQLDMPNNPIYHKDYTEFGESYQLVLPLNLEGLVLNDDSVRLLSHELEELFIQKD